MTQLTLTLSGRTGGIFGQVGFHSGNLGTAEIIKYSTNSCALLLNNSITGQVLSQLSETSK
jgi:hypothetical protein